MDRNDATAYIKSQTPDAFLQKAKKHGYICPQCGNGTGKDGDGIVLNKKTGKYKCFKCGIGGDILDLIGATFGLSDFNDQFQKAVEIYGITQKRRSARLQLSRRLKTSAGTLPGAMRLPDRRIIFQGEALPRKASTVSSLDMTLPTTKRMSDTDRGRLSSSRLPLRPLRPGIRKSSPTRQRTARTSTGSTGAAGYSMHLLYRRKKNGL